MYPEMWPPLAGAWAPRISVLPSTEYWGRVHSGMMLSFSHFLGRVYRNGAVLQLELLPAEVSVGRDSGLRWVLLDFG